MKSFENFNVAVCLSGQSRTFKYCAESINNYFTSNRNNRYFFFGHTSNKNWYKVHNDGVTSFDINNSLDLNPITLRKELQESFDFKSLMIENEKPSSTRFGHMLYSPMMANFLKQQYELKNNMMFDLVVRARFDVCYPHGHLFENHVRTLITEKTLYSNFGIMRNEFFLPNPDLIFYYGTSLTMDLVDSLHEAVTGFEPSNATGSLYKMVGTNDQNAAFLRTGEGTVMHKWITMKNILPMHSPIQRTIYRKAAIGLDYKKDWRRICELGDFV